MDIRLGSVDDLDVCLDLWLRAENELGARLGEPPIATDDVEWLPSSLAHLATTDPLRFLLASDGSTAVGFGLAFERDDFWYLSELMVAPEVQGRGIGTALLTALLPDPARRVGMTLATAVESRQPVSTMLYARFGIVPRVPLYWLEGIRDLEALPALPADIDVRPIDLDADADADAVDRLDEVRLGYARSQDHRMFLREGEGGWIYVAADGTAAGYAYVQPGAWPCPVAARDERFSAAIIRDLISTGRIAADKVTIQIGGDSGTLLPLLTRAGMRSDKGAQLIYCSNGAVPQPGYLHFGGYQP
jgi:GNAT superfamily N-acetyltransferase